MYVTTQNVLLREVDTREEAFAEIRRYVYANDLDMIGVDIGNGTIKISVDGSTNGVEEIASATSVFMCVRNRYTDYEDSSRTFYITPKQHTFGSINGIRGRIRSEIESYYNALLHSNAEPDGRREGDDDTCR